MAGNYQKSLFNDYERVLLEKENLAAENKFLKLEQALLIKTQKELEASKAVIDDNKKEIDALKKEILRLKGLLNIDGTNSGIPTSKTPLNKNKPIPNAREKSGKHIGGQPGHAKRKLERFKDEEITNIEEHPLESCPCCQGQLERTEKEITKDELDYEVIVKKTRHVFQVYKCIECGKESHQKIVPELKEENQYGSRVQALALSLMNQGNVSINKTRKMIYGLSERAINPSEGYLVKLQRRCAKQLAFFSEELRKALIKQPLLYWDDTVIFIDTRRSCLRFYGNEKLALYTAHRKKNKEGLDKDQVLQLLPSETLVMHDHNKVNYNKDYSYGNIECCAHLMRDLQRITDNLDHHWAGELKELLGKTNKERTEAIEQGEEEFTESYTSNFFSRFDCILLNAIDENKKDFNPYHGPWERTLILRIAEHKDHYLAWVVNFDLPFTNNLSERALRGVKSKLKISGQFQTEESAKNYACIKSYTETCYRNGVNEVDALLRLCQGNPYTLQELLPSL